MTSFSPPTVQVSPRRLRLVLQGRVQGMGFRPFVYRLAQRYRLGGWVANTARGVTIEIEGHASSLDAFCASVTAQAPPHAIIDHLSSQTIPVQHERTFSIRSSDSHDSPLSTVAPDLATCNECVRELFDPRARRYRYPFTTCAGCGPRYSIVHRLPYDRANTTMHRFSMCRHCAHEYGTVDDRRFHAETIACPACGPRVWLCDERGTILAREEDALARVCTILREGGIVAVKGLGGFQLWVDATNEAAVRTLRHRKHRPRKPLAVLFPSLDSLRAYCVVDDRARRVLTAAEAPIVLLRKHDRASLAASVAPDNPELGAMLPYTPLHHVLMADLGMPVVATSGNRSEEPIVTDEQEVLHRLDGIADAFLLHDRPIARPVDDSVVRVENGHVRMLRRARGYVPSPFYRVQERSHDRGGILAVGGHLKNTIAVTTDDHLVLSQHIGDLSTNEAYTQFVRTVDDQLTLFDVRPQAIACDLHPDYPSTAFAREFGVRHRLPVFPVQHHHAHLAAGMAEYGLTGPVLGVAWDGAGYGTDGTIWGGEFFVCERAEFQRIAHLRPFPLPGGEMAIKEPRRVALSLLHETCGVEALSRTLPPLAALGPPLTRALIGMLEHRMQCPMTTSMGRLFDGVSSMLGCCQMATFEGEAAMALQFAADCACGTRSIDISEAATPSRTDCEHLMDIDVQELLPIAGAPDSPFEHGHSYQRQPWIIDWRPLIRFLVEQVLSGSEVNSVAYLFHRACAALVVRLARRVDLDHVVLGGGVFQNRVLCELLQRECQRTGIMLYLPRQTPCNDGGLALGQAMLAQERLKHGYEQGKSL